ncbi:MAG: triose-phosphate isomerase [bacterium]
MRKPIIAGNWKMHNTVVESVDLANALKVSLADASAREVGVIIAPVFTALYSVSEVLQGHWIKVSAQDVFWEEKGAYTGEVSPAMLRDCGCSYSIIGHSERRQYFGETNESVNKKIRAALHFELMPILCVGELLEEREKSLTFQVVEKQVRGCLADISPHQMERIIVAYEPVWAIGTGKTATPQQANEVHAFIRDLISQLYGTKTAENLCIQYGGSVKPDNIVSLMREPDIDGALVGGASLQADSFTSIVMGALEASSRSL